MTAKQVESVRPGLETQLHRAVVGEAGRVVIPAPLRAQLKLGAGDEVVMRVVDGRLEVLVQADLVAQARAVVQRYRRRGKGLVSDELLQERRQEVKRGR